MYRKLIILSVFFLLSPVSMTGCNVEQLSRSLGESIPASPSTNVPVRLEPIPFVSDPREGFKTAREEMKPMLVFFFLSNCVNSKRMLETTFQDAEIKRLSRNFVCVFMDGATDTAFCELYNVQGFPTILILNSQGVEMDRLSGRQTTEQLLLKMHVVIQSTAAKVGGPVRK